MAEDVEFRGKPVKDADGNILPGAGAFTVACTVSPLGESDIDDVDIDGDSTKLQVLAPAGSPVREGMIAVIRGAEYSVLHIPFDWSIGRRAWMPGHTPPVRVIVERRVA